MTESDAITIAFSPSGASLHAVVHGAANYANTLAYWRRIAQALRERGTKSLLLVDETTGAPLSADEWKTLVEDMRGEGLEQVRIAHVKPTGLQQIEHCELHAREAGLNARVFTNVMEASVWLRYGEHSRPM
jgi:hypothetical protein